MLRFPAEPLGPQAPDVSPGAKGLLQMLLVVLGCSLLLYHQVLFFDKALYYRDIYHNYFAFLSFISRSLWAGDFPFWNPYLFAGTPQLAGLEPPIFYPLCWLFFAGLPYALALVLNLILHHLLAAAGIYLLGREYGWRWFSATLSACIFSYSGVMVSMNNFHPLQNTVAWLPLVFWAAHRLLTRQRLADLAAFAGIYGLQLLSGHLEIVYFESLLLLVYGLAQLWQRHELRRWRLMFLSLGAGLLALGLSAIEILPAILYLPHSIRQSGLEASSSQLWSLHPFLTLLLLLPEQAGNVYHQASLNLIFGDEKFGYSLFFLSSYLGVLTWALVISGLTRIRQIGALRFGFFLLVFAGSLALAYGKFTPLYHWLLALPGASFFRYPTKLLVFAAFGLVMAAGCALDAILLTPALLRRLMFTLGGLSALSLGAWLGLYAFEAPLLTWVKQILQLWRQDITPQNSETWSLFFLLFFNRQLLSFSSLCLLFGGMSWLLLRRQDRPRAAFAICLLAVSLDLLASGINSLWLTERERIERDAPPAAYLRHLGLERQPQARMLLANPAKELPTGFEHGLQAATYLRSVLYQHDTMQNNYSLIYGFRNLYGFWPARSHDSDAMAARYEQAIEAEQLVYRQSYEILGSVRYLVVLDPDSEPAMKAAVEANPNYRQLKAFPGSRVEIWENLAYLPRARFQYQAMPVKSRELMIAAMAAPQAAGLDLSRHVLLLDDAQLAAARKLVPPSEAAEKHWSEPAFTLEKNNAVELSFETNTSGYLVLADQNLPGWKAYDNGREVPILLANYLQRAVRVGPGPHRVRFEYHAPGFAAGTAISAASLILCLGLLFWGFRRIDSEPLPESESVAAPA